MKNLIQSMRACACLALGITLLMACGQQPATPPSGSGAGSASEASPESARKYLVIFSQCNNAEPYRAAQNAKMEALWSQHDDVILEIMDAQQDNARQISQIETAIRKRPDLLIVAPNEPGPLTAVMGQAVEAGIEVICLERDIVQPNYTTYIRSDNREIGRMAGEFIVNYLTDQYGEPRGKIVEMRGLLSVEGEINRHGGAHEKFEPHPGIEVLADPVADWLQKNAYDRMTEVLRAQPKIDVVYGHNDPMAVGAYLAAKELGREDEMIFVGVDGLGGESGGIKKVMDGVLAATFIYPLCVEKAYEIGNRILREPDFVPEKHYTIESQMITPDNAAAMYEEVTHGN